MKLSGHFVNAAPGRVFVSAWQGEALSNVAVLCAPPGVEELNASRRQMAVQARQLADGGLDCFILDYYGTGDSEGLDRDASFEHWQQSLEAAMQWLLQQGYRKLILWGFRVGALVIAACLRQHPREQVAGLLFWQPLESGRQWISALQRLQLLADRQTDGDEQFEVAGYQLTDALLQPLGDFDWGQHQEALANYPLEVLLVSSHANMTERLAGTFTTSRAITAVEGTPFWSIPESPLNTELNRHTRRRLRNLAGLAGDADE